MNKYVSDYIDIILKQIKYKKIHNAIALEIENHIDELSEEYISEGIPEEDAVKKAISQMGDPKEIGKKFHDTHKPKPEWSIIILTGIIIAFGLYMILSYSTVFLNNEYFNRQLRFTLIGILIFAGCYLIDYKRLEKYSLHLYITVTVLMFLTVIFGRTISGERYLIVLGYSINPSAISIPLLLIFYAGIIRSWCDGNVRNMIKLIAISFLPIMACMMQPSLANAMIIGAGFLTMLTFAICDKTFRGNAKRFLISIYSSITSLFVFFILYTINTSPYRQARLRIILNPQLDPTGAGYQNMILDKLLSSSVFWGNSWSTANGKGDMIHRLPGGNSEFIFTFIVSSFGWLFGIILIFLLLLFIIRIFNAASKISDRYGKYLSIGICCVFSLQAAANILMNLGIFPILGLPLPFVSYGGTSFICNITLIGLLLGVYRRKDIVLKEAGQNI